MIQISLPIYKEVPWEFVKPVMELARSTECIIRTYTRDSLVSRVRNRIFSDFLNSDNSHLVTIDVDTIFTYEDFEKLTCEENLKKDLVCGMVPVKSETPYFAHRVVRPFIQEGHLVEITHASPAFQVMSHECASKVARAFEDLKYTETWRGTSVGNQEESREGVKLTRYAVFQPLVVADEYLDEAWSFCHRARAAGCRLWLDQRINVGHLGTKVYRKTS